jgi:hypothetical protein
VAVLKKLADRGLTAGCVLANLHHRRIVPLMERSLRIFEMTEVADPVALARSRLLHDPLPRAFAVTDAARRRPQAGTQQRRCPVGVRDAPHRPTGERSS